LQRPVCILALLSAIAITAELVGTARDGRAAKWLTSYQGPAALAMAVPTAVPVSVVAGMQNLMLRAKVGQTIKLTVWRDGKKTTVTMKLEEPPARLRG